MKWTTSAVLGAVVLAGGIAGWRMLGHAKTAPEAPQAVPVSVVAAKSAEVAVHLRGIGTVRALNSVEIRPQVTGVLLDVPVGEGDEVAKGAVLAVIDPRPFQAALDKARAQLQQDQAQLGNAETDLRRSTALASREFASRQQVDTQTAAVARLGGVVAADEAEITQAEINLGYSVLRAPIAGRVGLRRVDAGNLVQANMTGPGILSVVQVQPISVLLTLSETELAAVKAAMARGAVAVLADSSDMRSELARGELLTPDNAIDPSSGTIGLKATFPNADRALTPGQFVSVRVQTGVAKGVAVPHEAIQHAQAGLFVFTVKPDDTVERRPVDVAYDDGAQAVLGKGVAEGDRVVTAGQSRIGPGTKVALREPADTGQRAEK